MRLVAEFGNPSLFITFTANTRWQEITNCLKAGETAADRPDLICRVFRLKLQKLIDLLQNKKVFGSATAHVCAVEWQKR